MADLSIGTLTYVRYVLRSEGLTPTALAKKAKISSTTLTRALNNPEHKFVLSTKTLEKIYEATGINPAPFLEASDSVDLQTSQVFSKEPIRRRLLNYDAVRDSTNHTYVVGTVGAHLWKHFSIVDDIRFSALNLRHTELHPKDCFALRVADDSFKLADPEDILFCTRFVQKQTDADWRRWGFEFLLVIVERRSADGFKVNLTARLLQKRPKGWDMTFVSNNKKLSDIVRISSFDNPEGLKIIGTIQYIIRNPGTLDMLRGQGHVHTSRG